MLFVSNLGDVILLKNQKKILLRDKEYLDSVGYL